MDDSTVRWLLRWKMPKPMDIEEPLISRADIEIILEIARERAKVLYRLKQAILNGDSLLEHQLARELVGLPKEITQ